MNHSLNFGREQGGGGGAGDLNWVIDSWGRSGGLETQINPATKIDWEWENPALAAINPSQDEADRKTHIMPGLMGQNLRSHNGILQSSYATSYPQSIMYGSTAMVENPVIFSSCSGGYEQRRRFLGLFEEEKGLNLVKREDGYGRIGLGLNLGGTYFSSQDMDMARFGKRARIGGAAAPVPLCQAQGCKADLSMAKHYHRRHKVCEMHSKSSTVVANGLTQRFCQQCSRFHPLSEFDEGKRSCRKRLADHNRRRRKPQPPLQPESSSGKTKDDLNDGAEGKKKGDSSSSTPSLDNSDKLQSSEERICSPKSASNLQIQSHTGQIQEESQSYEQYLQGVCNSKGPSLSLSSTSNANTNPNPKPEAHLNSISSSKSDAAAAHLDSTSSSVPWLRSKQEEQVFASNAFHSLLSLNPSTENRCSSPDWILGADQPNPAMNLLPIHHRNTFDPKNSVSGQSDLKFSELQASVRPYGSSLYRS